MAIMKVKVNNETIKELGLEGLLTDEKLIKAIDSEDREALRDLILDVAYSLSNNSISLEEFYYARHAFLSDELFDMFSFSCLKELFELFGYKSELVESEKYYFEVGSIKVYNENIEIQMFAEETMYDDYITTFVDAKRSKYVKR